METTIAKDLRKHVKIVFFGQADLLTNDNLNINGMDGF